MDTHNRLRQMELFSHFSGEQLDRLAELLSPASFPQGTTLLQERDGTRDAYLIDTGSVRVRRETSYGHYPLGKLGPGDMFGEIGFIDGTSRSADILTEEETTLYPLLYKDLEAMLQRDVRFQLALTWTFWKSLSAKLRQTNEVLARFFSEASERPETPVDDPHKSGEFRIDMAAKRHLFQEQRLSNMEINFLSSLSKEKRLDGGRTIFREGDPGDRMYIVLEGQVLITKMISGAGEEALAVLERGDYFGEMALIDNEPRSAHAKAHKNGAVVLAITRDVLEGILDIQKISSIRLLQILCKLLSKRLREIDDKLVGWYIFAAGSGHSLEVPS